MRLETYADKELSALCIKIGQTLRQVMTVMGRDGIRLAPVLSDEGRFEGVIGDGDIRRFVASGGSLSDKVDVAMNRTPVVRDQPGTIAEIRHFMEWRGIEYLPQVENDILVALHVLWLGDRGSDLTAVIMAGGLGSRLAPLTDTCPKPLIPIAGKPILTHIIEHLRKQGVTRFVLSVKYLREMIVDQYGDGSDLGVSIEYIHETQRMGTGGALSLIDPEMLSKPFLCMNGDILSDIDVGALASCHTMNAWDATMVLHQHSVTIPYGVIRRTEDHSFAGGEEKPTLNFNINAGIYMLSKSAVEMIPKNVFYDLPTLFSELVKHGKAAGTFQHDGRWIDIGNHNELIRARAILETQP